MRGSDPDAALYWLARMIDGGEDPKFIARRMFIAASEDIGNADPQALLIAEAAFKSAEVIGYPECRINLAQAAIYLALAPKSNAAEAGIDAALAEVRKGPSRNVPDHLRDRHRPGSENTARTGTRTAIPAAGWTSSTCPTACSAAASTAPAIAAGRPTAVIRLRAIAWIPEKPHVARKVTDCLLPWKQGEKLTSACISSEVLVL